MTCAEVDILLAEYAEGNLRGEPKAAVEAHLSECRLCAALAQDAAEAIAFFERVPDVEAPPELVTKLLFEAGSGAARKPSILQRMLGGWAGPILQPRVAMGMAMTMLSIAWLLRIGGVSERQLTPADLDPVKVYHSAEDRVLRWWGRGVQYYENLRVVYEIQTRLQEWGQEQPPQLAPQGDKK